MGGAAERLVARPSFLVKEAKGRGQARVPYIVGGIGPLSELPYKQFLLSLNEGASSDQDHIAYRLDTATFIPDRTKALKARAEGDSGPYTDIRKIIIGLAEDAKRDGFDSISFLCNTIHAWRADVLRDLEEIGIPWISLMDATVEAIQRDHPGATRIGILGTDGTLMTRLYTDAVIAAGMEPINLELDSPEQQSVMDAIYNDSYGIKATGDVISQQATDKLRDAADHLKRQGAQVVIGGCTEIPLALNEKTYSNLAVIDPLRALAQVHLDLAKGRTQLPH